MIKLVKFGFVICMLSIFSTMNCKAQSNEGKQDTVKKEDKSVKKLDSTNSRTPVIPLDDHNAPMPNALEKGKKDSVKKEKGEKLD